MTNSPRNAIRHSSFFSPGNFFFHPESFATSLRKNHANAGKKLVAHPLLGKFRMNVSVYQAAAAMNANARWQDMVSENLASSSIPGARGRDISFSSVQAGSQFVIPAANTAINFQPGELRSTGNPLDFALEGGGLLADLLLFVQFRDADRLLSLRFLDLGLALEHSGLLTDLLFPVELGQADRLLALVFAGADFLEPNGAGEDVGQETEYPGTNCLSNGCCCLCLGRGVIDFDRIDHPLNPWHMPRDIFDSG
jgi:hypothetical protein